MHPHHDAPLAAAVITTRIERIANDRDETAVAAAGRLALAPNVINTIPVPTVGGRSMHCVPTARIQRWLIALVVFVVSAGAPLTAVAQSSGPPPPAHTEVFRSDEADPTPTPSGASGGDVAAYLSDVRDHADDLRTSIDRFLELINSAPLNDDEIGEAVGIQLGWSIALATAQKVDVPQGMSKVQDAYIVFATAIDDMDTAFRAFLKAEEGTPKREKASADFQAAIATAKTAYDTLDELLQAQGN